MKPWRLSLNNKNLGFIKTDSLVQLGSPWWYHVWIVQRHLNYKTPSLCCLKTCPMLLCCSNTTKASWPKESFHGIPGTGPSKGSESNSTRTLEVSRQPWFSKIKNPVNILRYLTRKILQFENFTLQNHYDFHMFFRVFCLSRICNNVSSFPTQIQSLKNYLGAVENKFKEACSPQASGVTVRNQPERFAMMMNRSASAVRAYMDGLPRHPRCKNSMVLIHLARLRLGGFELQDREYSCASWGPIVARVWIRTAVQGDQFLRLFIFKLPESHRWQLGKLRSSGWCCCNHFGTTIMIDCQLFVAHTMQCGILMSEPCDIDSIMAFAWYYCMIPISECSYIAKIFHQLTFSCVDLRDLV